MRMNSFYSEDELKTLGFKSIGKGVLISRKASIYGAPGISIGSSVRVDDFCILSGKMDLGNYIHISAYTGLFGGNVGIVLKDYVTISSRNAIYAISDDYSGEYMTNPMVGEKYRNVIAGEVCIEKSVIIGSGCVVLPGVHIGEGAAVGAMSLVNRDLEAWTMNKGIPCRKYRKREKNILNLQNKFEEENRG